MIGGRGKEDRIRGDPLSRSGDTDLRPGKPSHVEEPKELTDGSEVKRLLMLGHLAARVAHEVNNPLGGILVYAHLLLEDTPEGDPRRKNIERIIRETDRCKNMVRDLLNYSRQTAPIVRATDLTLVVREAVSLMSQQHVLREVEIDERFSPDVPTVEIDASQMEEVFTNILQNAGEAMEGKGKITITVARNRDEIYTSFQDTGPGIATDHIERVFDPFFTTKQSGHGTGLGLAVCRGIVERHGGRISIDSHPGEGTTFTVSLPVRQSKVDGPPPGERESG